MKTISGVISTRTSVSLSDAAAILSSFAATETGASDAVSVYIRRATDAFNQLVQLHNELRFSQSSHNLLGKEYLGGDNSEYQLKSSRKREIITKEKDEPVKVDQFPEEKHEKKKPKKQRSEKIRDLDVKSEALVKTASEEYRERMNHSAVKVKNKEKVKGVTEMYSKGETGLAKVDGDSMKKDKKKKKKKLSEGNGGMEVDTLVVETKKRKNGEIDGGLASDEQNSKRKSKKQRIEGK